MYFKRFLIAALLAIIIFANSALAEDKKVPLNLQMKHLFSALEYDKNFSTRMEDTLIIGILYFPEEPNSRREALELYKSRELFLLIRLTCFIFLLEENVLLET
jgi:hypothetical protein